MAKLVFGMNQSLDGYVDHMGFAPGPTLFRHFIEEAQAQAGSVYGRRMYEIMFTIRSRACNFPDLGYFPTYGHSVSPR